MSTTSLKISQISTTCGTQIRAKIDSETVDNYALEMREGTKFPPIDVFHDGSQYIAADGFHRIMAASRNGFKDILANIHKGAKSDALKFALSANCAHGLKRTNADKRRSVELALAEWPTLSDRELARICAVSDMFVGSIRSQLQTDCSCPQPPRTGADGKTRKVPKKKAKPNREQKDDSDSKPEQFKPKQVVGPVAPEPEPEDENPAEETAENLHSWNVALEEIKSLFAMLPAEFQAEFLAWAKEQTR